MISGLDIYRSANVLLKHHGKDALIEAAMRAETMLEGADHLFSLGGFFVNFVRSESDVK